MFTEYRFSPEFLKARTAELAAGLQANTGRTDFLAFGLQVVADRLAKAPVRYRDYGPYWWALKEVLRANGRDYGPQSDPLIAKRYRGKTEAETLVAAEEFRTDWLRMQAVGTNQIMLDVDAAEFWLLYDEDMEQMA